MDWDDEIRVVTTQLGPSVRREIELSVADLGRHTRSMVRTGAEVSRPRGILGASPSLYEYCSGYAPNLRPSDLDDIQSDVLAAGEQAAVLTGHGTQWPVVRLGDNELLVALFDESALGPDYVNLGDLPGRVDAYVRRLRAAGTEVFMADPAAAVLMYSNLLTPFLGARLAAARLYPAVALSNNVEVSNTKNGWNIVYRPLLLRRAQMGLGGPGSPVKGYIRPGTYLFGIIKGGQPAQWDTTSWSVPRPNTIHVPLP